MPEEQVSKKISELDEITEISGSHYIPVSSATGTAKISFENLVNSSPNDLEIHMLYGYNSLTLVQTEGVNIVIDASSAEDAERIIAHFDKFGVDHVDYFVISHFHGDHCLGYASVLSRCDSSTRVFRGMNLTDPNNDNYTRYQSWVAEIDAACSAIGVTMEIPENGQRVFLTDKHKAFLEFWNTDQTYEETYKQSYKESGGLLDKVTPSYNDYSVITRVENGNSSYVDCGDLETAAQRLNADNMRPCSICKYPHHNINVMGYYRFFENLAPQAFVYSIYKNELEERVPEARALFQSYYLYRYLKQCRYADIYTNTREPVDVVISNGNANVYNGYLMNVNAGCKDYDFVQTTVRGAFPPAVLPFEEQPHKLLQCGLAQLSDWIRYIPNDNYIEFTSSSEYYGNAVFMQEARKVFGISATGAFDFRATFENGELCLTRSRSAGRKQKAIIYNTFVAADFPNTGAKLLTEITSRTPYTYAFPTPLGRDTSDNGNLTTKHGVSTNLFVNDMVLAVCTGNVLVPLVRCTNNTFVGTGASTAATPEIYYVTIASYKIHQCFSVNTSTQAVTQRQILELRNSYLN